MANIANRRILVIDDEDDIRNLYQKILAPVQEKFSPYDSWLLQ